MTTAKPATGREWNRRAFLKTGLAAAAAAAFPERLMADPYAPWRRPVSSRRSRPVRVRGSVRARGRGVPGVAISDGLDVVRTDAEGRFELVTTVEREFVSMSVPAGHRIPVSEVGTARFYRPIRPVTEMEASFELEPLDGDDSAHTLVLLGDIQTQDTTEMSWFHQQSVPDIQASLRELAGQETFGIACGDIMYDDLELYPEYERGVQRIGIPFFQVIGNHDLDQDAQSDEASTRTFSSRFGPRYYSFDRGAVHYVVLDDVLWHGSGYIGYLDADALAWLERDLSGVEPGRPVIVSTHIPVVGSRHLREGRDSPGAGMAVMNRQALYRILEPYEAHILTGHTHECEHVFEGGAHEHVTGAICGAWWSGPICWDGTPNGYCLYEVEGETVTWRYKTAGKPADHQMRLYAPGAAPDAPDELMANVWNADPEWIVTWHADGGRRGPMARRVSRDPWSVEIHAGDDLPPRRPWVDPIPTGHCYFARLPAGAREVTVEAVDRFGRTYAERLALG